MLVQKDQKIKILKLWEYLCRESDETHPCTSTEILSYLSAQGIDCNRKTLYQDIKYLRSKGYNVVCIRRKCNEYYAEQTNLNEAELQILMDAVQAATFLTQDKTDLLIDKLSSLVSTKRAEILKNNIILFQNPKSNNENIFINVTVIAKALELQRKIGFYYFDYDVQKKKNYRKENRLYIVNPVSTVFSNDNYYLLCYDDKHGNLAHYRIDRMDKLRMLDEVITPSKNTELIRIQKHKRQLFGMFVGTEQTITFLADKSLIDVILDKFGTELPLTDCTNNKFMFTASVQVSPVFLGWCCSFGTKLEIVSPNSLRLELKEYIETLQTLYQ